MVIALGIDDEAIPQRVGMCRKLVFDLDIFGRKNDLFALHRTIDQTGHKFLGAFLDIPPIPDRQPCHASEIIPFQTAIEIEFFVLVEC